MKTFLKTVSIVLVSFALFFGSILFLVSESAKKDVKRSGVKIEYRDAINNYTNYTKTFN